MAALILSLEGLTRRLAIMAPHNPALHPCTYAVTLIFGSGLLLGYAALRLLVAPRVSALPGEVGS